MGRASLPGEDEQRGVYGEVIRYLAPRPVVIRTLDAGDDKPVRRRHACAVTFECGARAANAKSILAVLALGVKDGEELLVRAEGEGAEDVVDALARALREQRGSL